MSLRKKLVILLALTSLTAMAAEPTDTLTLSLEECIQIGLSTSPTVKVADMEVTRVEYSKKEVIGSLLPTIAFNGAYTRTIERQTMSMNNQSIRVGNDNSWDLGFTASMPLISASIWQKLKLSDVQILQNIELARSSRLNLVNQIKNAYYQTLYAEAAYKVVLDTHARATLNADITEGMLKVGTASEYDLIRAKVQVTNVEPKMIESEVAIRSAMLQLKVLMGLDVAQEIKLDKQLSDYEQTMYEDAMGIDRSLQNNTDLKQLQLKTDYLHRSLKIQKMQWMPTLSLSFNYKWSSLSSGGMFSNFSWHPNSNVALSLSVPIFNGGQRYHQYKQAEVALQEMDYQRANLENQLKMKVDIKMQNITQNIKQISSSAASMRSALKANDIMQTKYRIGASSYYELYDSEVAFTTAQLSYYQSIYNYLVAKSDLELLLGTADAPQPIQ